MNSNLLRQNTFNVKTKNILKGSFEPRPSPQRLILKEKKSRLYLKKEEIFLAFFNKVFSPEKNSITLGN